LILILLIIVAFNNINIDIHNNINNSINNDINIDIDININININIDNSMQRKKKLIIIKSLKIIFDFIYYSKCFII